MKTTRIISLFFVAFVCLSGISSAFYVSSQFPLEGYITKAVQFEFGGTTVTYMGKIKLTSPANSYRAFVDVDGIGVTVDLQRTDTNYWYYHMSGLGLGSASGFLW